MITCTIMTKDGGDLSRVDVQVDPLHRLHLLLLAKPPESLPQVPDHHGLCASHATWHLTKKNELNRKMLLAIGSNDKNDK